jgi:hypothetical protein
MTMESIINYKLTKQIALTLEDLEKLMKHEFKSKRLERSRDLFVLLVLLVYDMEK